MNKRVTKKIITYLVVILITLFGIYKDKTSQNFSDVIDFNDGLFYSCHIDVGQGDCSVIKLPDNRIIMIDSGMEDSYDNIEIFLDKNNIDKIDYLVASHPHSDHIGSMEKIVRNYQIGEIYMTRAVTTTDLYKNLLLAIKEKNLKIKTAEAGVSMLAEENITADFVAPCEIDEEELNNCSAVLLIKYKNNGFLYTGDAEESEEETITVPIKANVLKVGHHGSQNSTTDEFLNKVQPEIAVISNGEDNDYGHPHYEVLLRLESIGCEVFRTDESGTIIIKSDGEKILK